ncbi:MAG: oxygen-independent coproporphyrinogen III oxidase [Prevotellaceae bacterium]|jgi:oxygen-independent coproporphyrinogen-3 oxidase|nr:oxygen-independent coproporphyrinogen III oxidase [Prevotellaceae bacterium]
MTNSDLLDKYNVPVPRYTSYPPANYFHEFTNDAYREAVVQSDRARDNHLSFYLHIPFCGQLCHYCGCNSYPMARPEAVDSYVKALHQEIDLLLPMLDSHRRISQIHYGGGTPTALPLHYIRELNDHLLSAFSTIETPEIAIECHPGYLTVGDWYELTQCGFNRYSIGIQDFDEAVLKTVNRRPSHLPVEKIFDLLRRVGARINLDFLYGLPGQSADSFADTIGRAIALKPDRIVTFSYAHVPWVNKRQLILERAGLPAAGEKSRMFIRASELLQAAGYVRIGMDHFVLPDDELNIALNTHRLHRNFQGYCTRRTTAQVYAFGVTGISQLDTAYMQNSKSIDEYVDALHTRRDFCIRKGYVLNRDEQITREVIEMLMCNYCIRWDELSARLELPVERLKAATAYNEERLFDFRRDGLLTFDADKIQMTPAGYPFVRNVAASLDKLMGRSHLSFSKPI